MFVGPRVNFTNDLYPRSPRISQGRNRYADRGWLEPTVVKRGASLGAGAIILPESRLENSAWSVRVRWWTKSLPPYALAVGSPARVRGWVCTCGHPLAFGSDAAMCTECSLTFIRAGGAVQLLPPLVSPPAQ